MKNILALGAENKTTFTFISGGKVFPGPVFEDLNDIDNLSRYKNEIKKVIKKNGGSPEIIACDMHPDYRSSILAEEFSKGSGRKIDLIKVQHHHAHIVSCMYDNDIDGSVLGISFDGTGYGTDGRSWGGEVLVCTRKEFKRLYHLKYVPQPGGDRAAREPWRMALSYLYQAYGDSFRKLDIPLFQRIGENRITIVTDMIKKGINSPETSSMGRLFDAVSSLIGVCDVSYFEAEAAILLEKEADRKITGSYDHDILGDEIDLSRMIKGIVMDLSAGKEKSEISAKFHNTIAKMIFEIGSDVCRREGLDKVLLSGGCFQNKYLSEKIEMLFKEVSPQIKLYKHKKCSPTDLGVSVGQAVVAASLLRGSE